MSMEASFISELEKMKDRSPEQSGMIFYLEEMVQMQSMEGQEMIPYGEEGEMTCYMAVPGATGMCLDYMTAGMSL